MKGAHREGHAAARRARQGLHDDPADGLVCCGGIRKHPRQDVGWCREAFAEALGLIEDDATRSRRLAQVVAVCDATTWRILRFDGHLSPQQTEDALRELLLPLLPHR